jgi:hypothetical protein
LKGGNEGKVDRGQGNQKDCCRQAKFKHFILFIYFGFAFYPKRPEVAVHKGVIHGAERPGLDLIF